jgi:hypothetical protein
MRLVVAALLLSMLACAACAQPVRCFVRDYTLEEMNHTEQGSGAHLTIYWAHVDVLAGAPLMLNLDDIGLSRVQINNCADGATTDMLRLMWSADPAFSAPFAALPLKCAARDSLSFGLSTLGAEQWGRTPRTVRDGSLFGAQGGRASMLTGAYHVRQTPERHRVLSLRMTSYRTFERPLAVRTCVWADQVPYDMPAEMREVPPPRLLPLMDCTMDLGGRCSANLGYVNSAGMPLDVRHPSPLNKLVPLSMENGFQMLQRFEDGTHLPSEFRPALHVSWVCDHAAEPSAAVWRLDGLELALNSHDQMCNAADEVDTLNVNIERVAARHRAMAKYQDTDPFISRELKPPVVQYTNQRVSVQLAETHWRKAGVENARMSRAGAEARAQAAAAAAEVYGRVPDAAAPLNVTELAIKP